MFTSSSSDKQVSNAARIYTLASTAAVKKRAISHLPPYPGNLLLEAENSAHFLPSLLYHSSRAVWHPVLPRTFEWKLAGNFYFLETETWALCMLGEFLHVSGLRTAPWPVTEWKPQFCQKFSALLSLGKSLQCINPCTTQAEDLSLRPSTHGEKPNKYALKSQCWQLAQHFPAKWGSQDRPAWSLQTVSLVHVSSAIAT